MDSLKVFLVVGVLVLSTPIPEGQALAQVPLRKKSESKDQSRVVNQKRSEVVGRKDSPPVTLEGESIEQSTGATEPLRAFESAKRMNSANVELFVGMLLFGVVGAIVIFFIVYALLFEPSEVSRPYRSTKVERGENYVPYRHSKPRDELDQ